MREEGRDERKGKERLKMEEKPLKVKRGDARVHTDVPMKTPSGSSNPELPDPVPQVDKCREEDWNRLPDRGHVSCLPPQLLLQQHTVLQRTIGPDPVGAAVPHEDRFLRGVPTWDGQDGRKAGWKNSLTLAWRSRPRSAPRTEIDLLVTRK